MTVFTGNSDPKVRRTMIGGSDVAKICGVSRFGGPMDVFMEKMGYSAPLVETEAMGWGKILEDTVARHWSKVTGIPVRRVNRTVRHPVKFFAAAHVDRLAGPDILEVKTSGVFAASDYGESDTDQVPADAFLQGLHYAHVLDRPRVHYAVLIGGQSFRKFVYERDRELETEIEDRVSAFWHDNIEKGIPPDVDASESAAQYLSLRHPAVLVPTVELTEEIETEALAYDVARREVKQWEVQQKLRRNRLAALLGDGGEASRPGLVVRWSDTEGAKRLDLDALRAAHPKIAAEFTRQDPPSRRLTVSIKED